MGQRKDATRDTLRSQLVCMGPAESGQSARGTSESEREEKRSVFRALLNAPSRKFFRSARNAPTAFLEHAVHCSKAGEATQSWSQRERNPRICRGKTEEGKVISSDQTKPFLRLRLCCQIRLQDAPGAGAAQGWSPQRSHPRRRRTQKANPPAPCSRRRPQRAAAAAWRRPAARARATRPSPPRAPRPRGPGPGA